MTQDAFELLQAANPLPEDPPPLPIAPLLERVEQLPPQPPGAEAEAGKEGPRAGSTSIALVAVARRGARVHALDDSAAAEDGRR